MNWIDYVYYSPKDKIQKYFLLTRIFYIQNVDFKIKIYILYIKLEKKTYAYIYLHAILLLHFNSFLSRIDMVSI